MKKGRKTATKQCRACIHLCVERDANRHKYYCWACDGRRVSFGDARTSPAWCPLGHVLAGVPYPTFTPGPDPWKAGSTRAVDIVQYTVENFFP